jgi:hypothetical protein
MEKIDNPNYVDPTDKDETLHAALTYMNMTETA